MCDSTSNFKYQQRYIAHLEIVIRSLAQLKLMQTQQVMRKYFEIDRGGEYKPIILTGSSRILNELATTSVNGNEKIK